MTNLLTPEELSMFQNLPEEELVDLAIDLDIPVPEEIDLVGMLNAVILHLAELGEREGLPYSSYDAEDLEALDEYELRAIANLNGIDRNRDSYESRVPMADAAALSTTVALWRS